RCRRRCSCCRYRPSFLRPPSDDCRPIRPQQSECCRCRRTPVPEGRSGCPVGDHQTRRRCCEGVGSPCFLRQLIVDLLTLCPPMVPMSYQLLFGSLERSRGERIGLSIEVSVCRSVAQCVGNA